MPQTGFLSTFDDPPEDPLREGTRWLPPFLGDKNTGAILLDMRKEGGTATDKHHDAQLDGFLAYSYWTQQQFEGDNVEVWGMPVGGQLGAALETWRLFMWQQLDPPVGYLVYIGGALSKETRIRKYNGGAFSFEGLGGSGESYCDGLMLRINGQRIEVWAYNGAGDIFDDANWHLRCFSIDTSYRGPFYIGMGVEDPTTGGLGWTAFGGGIPNRTQIYRILPSLSPGKE